MVQFAVVLKNQDWTVFEDGVPIQGDLSRSAAIELAERLAFQREERGVSVELLIQDYVGGVTRRLSGGLGAGE